MAICFAGDRTADAHAIRYVAVGSYGDGGHTFLLYRTESGEVKMLHLCWHLILRHQNPSPKCKCWAEPNLEPENAIMVAAHASNVVKSNAAGELPYAFSDPRAYFNKEGLVIASRGQIGLTCATFVLAIFNISGCDLLAYDTWRARLSDLKAKQKLLADLKKDHPAHAVKAEPELRAVRYRPLEVVAGAAGRRPPMSFNRAKVVAWRIAAELKKRP